MKSKNEWRTDKEYVSIVADLLAQPAVQKLANYTQHHHSTRLQHSIAVSYDSYKIAKKMHLDYRSTARAGLLHDLFYYDFFFLCSILLVSFLFECFSILFSELSLSIENGLNRVLLNNIAEE